MSDAFADTGFWIAFLSPRDALHVQARRLQAMQQFDRIITTEMVLAEFLNDIGSRGTKMRLAASQFVTTLRGHAEVRFVPQTSAQFWDAAAVYHERTDKAWSLTDCASFLVMREHGLQDALTYDHHFEQMGFRALLRGG